MVARKGYKDVKKGRGIIPDTRKDRRKGTKTTRLVCVYERRHAGQGCQESRPSQKHNGVEEKDKNMTNFESEVRIATAMGQGAGML